MLSRPVDLSMRRRKSVVGTKRRRFATASHRGRCDLIALARQLMWNPNWRAHATAALGHAEPLDLLPPFHAW